MYYLIGLVILLRDVTYGPFLCSFFIILICFLKFWNNFNTSLFSANSLYQTYLWYLIASFISMVLSPYWIQSFVNFARDIFFAIFFIMISQYITCEKGGPNKLIKTIYYCSQILIWSILITAAWAILAGSGGKYEDGRYSGIFENPSTPGHFLSISVPLIYCYRKYYLGLRAPIGLVLLGLVGLILTGSRSAVAAYVITLTTLYYILSVKKSLKLRTVFLLCFLTGALIYLISNITINEEILVALRIQNGLSGREVLWYRAAEIIQNNFWFGTGGGTFRYEYLGGGTAAENIQRAEEIRYSYLSGQHSVVDEFEGAFGAVVGGSSHNLILDILVSFGTVGLIAFMMFLKGIFKYLNKFSKSSDPIASVSVGVKIIMIVYIVRAQFEPVGLLGGAISANFILWAALMLPMYLYSSMHKDAKS